MAKKDYINFTFTGEPGNITTELDYALLDKYFPQAILRLREMAQKMEDAVVTVELHEF